MNLIDNYQGDLPELCLLTDDPFRVKMIAANYLDKVEIFTENRGQIGLTGEFQTVPVTVLSVGIGKTSTLAYLLELCLKKPMKLIVYLGDCITKEPSLAVGTIVYVTKVLEEGRSFTASDKLLQRARDIMAEKRIKVYESIATTRDRYLSDKKYLIATEAKILDFTTSAIYEVKQVYSNIEVLSILNVCENISAQETLEEAVRQSGGHLSVRLALQTMVSFNGNIS